jgi:hypothetical protein
VILASFCEPHVRRGDLARGLQLIPLVASDRGCLTAKAVHHEIARVRSVANKEV